MARIRFTIRVDEDLLASLRLYQRKHGNPKMAQVVRDLIYKGLEAL